MQDNTEQQVQNGAAGNFSVFLSKAKKLSGKLLKKMAPSVLLGSAVFIFLFWAGLGDSIGNELAALSGPVRALFLIFAICLIPSVSPLMGHGMVLAIAASILTAEQIAEGMVKPIMALAALLALDAQFGGGFIPPGLALGENEPETISAWVPAIVYTRLITVPLAVVLVCLFSF